MLIYVSGNKSITTAGGTLLEIKLTLATKGNDQTERTRQYSRCDNRPGQQRALSCPNGPNGVGLRLHSQETKTDRLFSRLIGSRKLLAHAEQIKGALTP
jgi:hypothetical protein